MYVYVYFQYICVIFIILEQAVTNHFQTGGVSGLGISVFLFGTKIKFIFEFGVVFFATTGLASFFSLIFLSALLGAVGPVRTKGYLWDSQISSYGVGSTGSKPSVSSSYGPVNI